MGLVKHILYVIDWTTHPAQVMKSLIKEILFILDLNRNIFNNTSLFENVNYFYKHVNLFVDNSGNNRYCFYFQ